MIIKKASYLKDYKLKVQFSDGVTKIVDFESFLKNPKEILLPLQDLNYFKNFYLDEITISWPNGLDFDPYLLYDVGVIVESERKTESSLKKRKSHRIEHHPVYAFAKKRSKKTS